MTNRPEGDARAARNERREAARQRAQRARTQQKRRQRGVRLGLQIGIGVVLLAAATIVTLVLVDSVKPAGPGPSTMSQGGITIGQDMKAVSGSAPASPSATASDGAGTVRITLYVDYLCPTCGQFEEANGDYIESLVDSGAATVDIHPVAILANRSQGTKYSLRAANAAACVAEHSPDRFYAVNKALFANQPEEGTAGLTDAELTKVVTGVSGLQDRRAIERCIADQDYSKWVDERTNAVAGGDIPGSSITEFPGTPLVLVNGQQYELTSPITNDDFRTFVVTAAGASEPTATPTATATPTPTASRTPSPSPTKR
ncbi:thioredoxin domain-containing protein [Curtobacterium sp. MCLR17_036]|uniref:DsbA family protein n=1 Tax=Curtobacterium sp. MCLR17_036 TaxID=2175620 RepID=UPI0011B645F9|nr:thioredoxin domain-containing protein [Curtobacterium sp. MCLR17_036]WIE64502.1 thioredoxin domain-containing protein [Curtobacterium sp. MCLR17_036]